MSKKVRQKDVDFPIIEITSKNYVDMTRKFVDVFFSTYWLKSISIRCWFYVLCSLACMYLQRDLKCWQDNLRDIRIKSEEAFKTCNPM